MASQWELSSRLSPGWVPREVSLKISHIKLLHPVDYDTNRQEILKSQTRSIVVAVSAESSRRILRSSELELNPDNRLDTSVNLSFTLPYAHCLKGDLNNLLVVSIQRRKRYKHRPIKGYKTLGTAAINLSQVLQHDFSGQLEMLDKEGQSIALLSVSDASTTSIEGKTSQDDGEDSDDSLEASDIEDDDRNRRTALKPMGQLRRFMGRIIHDPKLLSKLKRGRLGRRAHERRRRRHRGEAAEGQQTEGEEDDDDDDDDEDVDEDAAELDEIALLEMLRMGSEVASLYSDESDDDAPVPHPPRPYLRPFYDSPARPRHPAADLHHRLGAASGSPHRPLQQRDELRLHSPGQARVRQSAEQEESPSRVPSMLRTRSFTFRDVGSPSRAQQAPRADAGAPSSQQQQQQQQPPQPPPQQPQGDSVATTPDQVTALLGRNPTCVLVGCSNDRVYSTLVQSAAFPLHHALADRGVTTGAVLLPADRARAQACLLTLLTTAETMAKEREARAGVRSPLQPAFTCVIMTETTAVARLLAALVTGPTRVRCPPSFRAVPTDKQDVLCRRIGQADPEYHLLFCGDDWPMLLSHFDVEAASLNEVVKRLSTYITSGTHPLSFEAGQVQVQTEKESLDPIAFLSCVQLGDAESEPHDLVASASRDDLDLELDYKPAPREGEEPGSNSMVGVKGAIKSVAIDRFQEPFVREQEKHGRLQLHVARGPPKQKIKRLMTKKELEGSIDVSADAVLCKHSRGKPKLRLVVDGCVYPSVEQCYITGVHPSTTRRVIFGSFVAPTATTGTAAAITTSTATPPAAPSSLVLPVYRRPPSSPGSRHQHQHQHQHQHHPPTSE